MQLYSPSDVRAMDARAVEGGVTVERLMRAAGAAVAAVANRVAPSGEILLVCGKGHNGGDGLASAQRLATLGRTVHVWLTSPEAGLDALNRTLAEEARSAGAAINFAPDDWPAGLRPALVIDGLLGTGLSQPVRPLERRWIEAMNASGAPVLSVDVPSGLNADTGQPLGCAVHAAWTVTLVGPKVGLALFPGRILAGKLYVAGIGMPESALPRKTEVDWTTLDTVRPLLPVVQPDDHKGSRGRVVLAAGSADYPGAACLASTAALRAGAGMAFLAAPSSLASLYRIKLNEVIVRPVPDGSEPGCFGAEAVDPVLNALKGSSSLVIGPGLSCNESTLAFIKGLLPQVGVPAIVDADALNLLSQTPQLTLPESCVLTPHPGEMGRLLGSDAAAVESDRFNAVREAVALYGCVVLLKGPATVVASPDGRIALNSAGTPALATAGSGDVLSGVIGALLGRGLDPFDAARCGSYLHGLAGQLAARCLSEDGVMASDVASRIPGAFASVRLGNSEAEPYTHLGEFSSD